MVPATLIFFLIARLAEMRNRHIEVNIRKVKSAREKLWTNRGRGVRSRQIRMNTRKAKWQHRT